MTNKNKKLTKFLLTGASLLLLAACVQPAVYQPRTSANGPGYSDMQIAANRYRVTFTGNSATERDTVEDYLLRRAAEVTIQAGFSHFVFDTRNTQSRTDYYTFSSRFGFGYGYPGYYWGGGYGPYGYGGFGYGGFGYDPFLHSHIDADTRYQAYAEIVLLRGPQAASDPKALEARDVLNRLSGAPRVVDTGPAQ